MMGYGEMKNGGSDHFPTPLPPAGHGGAGKGSRGLNSDRRVWTKEEDDAIRDLVRKLGTRSWSIIAEHIITDYGIQGRTGKQCRERWHNHLDPSINKDAWTEMEERVMAEAHRDLGNKWSEIAKRLPGRTDNHVKNHWYSFMRRNVRRLNREVSDTITYPSPPPVPAFSSQNNHATLQQQQSQFHPHMFPPPALPAGLSPAPAAGFMSPPQHEHVHGSHSPALSDDTRASAKSSTSRGKGRARKAANLAELQRYFTAAADAAAEVLRESGGREMEHMADLKRLQAEAGIKPLDSPSRMVALNLVSGNELFRDKLRRKLEETGGVEGREEGTFTAAAEGGSNSPKLDPQAYYPYSMYNPAATPQQQHAPTLFSALLPGAPGTNTPLSHLTAETSHLKLDGSPTYLSAPIMPPPHMLPFGGVGKGFSGEHGGFFELAAAVRQGMPSLAAAAGPARGGRGGASKKRKGKPSLNVNTIHQQPHTPQHDGGGEHDQARKRAALSSPDDLKRRALLSPIGAHNLRLLSMLSPTPGHPHHPHHPTMPPPDAFIHAFQGVCSPGNMASGMQSPVRFFDQFSLVETPGNAVLAPFPNQPMPDPYQHAQQARPSSVFSDSLDFNHFDELEEITNAWPSPNNSRAVASAMAAAGAVNGHGHSNGHGNGQPVTAAGALSNSFTQVQPTALSVMTSSPPPQFIEQHQI